MRFCALHAFLSTKIAPHPLPFAEGEGEGWGGVVSDDGNPPPNLPLRDAQGEERTPPFFTTTSLWHTTS